jgi:malonyl-CoA/methylmalonyl-CoA synthetase
MPDSLMTPGSLYTGFERSLEKLGEKPVFRAPGGEVLMTYAGLRENVCRMANALVALGIEAGDRVTVQAEKSIASVVLYLATLKCGAVFQPLNTAYTLPEVEYFVGDAEPKIVVCDPAKQSAMRAIGDRHKVLSVVNLGADGQGSLADLAARMEPRHETVPRSIDDLAGLLYTSGTTGRSKGAMLSHHNLASNAKTLLKLWQFRPNDVLLHALPFYHVHGLFVALNTALLNGSEVIWFDRFDADRVLDAIPRATMMMGVPTFYTRLLASPRLTRALCRKMRVFICGSAPLAAETHREFERRTGHAILERYGMTETGMVCSNPYAGARVAGTVGFPLPDVQLRLVNGVIEVKGPNVFKGYWRQPERTREDLREDGFFITGDLAEADPVGRITIVGRAKDLIISGGLNVYPKEVEEALDALPGVVESAVIGVPHPDFGEGVVAAVTANGRAPTEKAIVESLGERLAKFKVPKRVFIVDDLPRNSMGKVQKALLRERFAATFTKA